VLACKRALNPEDQLPPETRTGANTFGCLIDGQPWIPNGGGGFSQTRPMIGGYIGQRDCHLTNYNVSIFTSKSDRTNLEIYLKNVIQTGRYPLNKSTLTTSQNCNPENYALYMIDGKTIDDPDYNYITTTEYIGFVDVTRADTINRIVAGTFEFEAIDKPSGKEIKVTQGRFDINTKTLN